MVSTQSTWGLDQLRLLRSQHKMARLLLVAALCLASVKAAVIPVEEIVDNLQSFLTAPEESGLRLKRSTGEWDKEFDLSSMGILFQLKYNNPANPFEGGRAHVKVPGARFIRNAPFDDMDLDIEFNGGSAIDGLFDMKVDYKFIQKFMFLADRPQEGSFVLYRKMEEIIDLAWPKMTPAASDLEEVSGSVYKIKWTGHGETTKGFLRRVSPVETNMVASVNVRNMKVDAIVWKSFAGQKYGFTLTNDKFTLLAGKH